jgi:hypothetical protein
MDVLETTLTSIMGKFSGITRQRAIETLCGFYLYISSLQKNNIKVYIKIDEEYHELKDVL